MALREKQQITLEAYLALETSTREKSEYFRGEVFAMGGASAAHNSIVANTVGEIRAALRSTPCRVFPSDLRVKVSTSGLHTYPDAVVVCGAPSFEQPGDTLLNPTLIVEVLSESTEAYDRGGKFEQYRKLASLSGYLLIAQDRVLVELFTCQHDDRWLLASASDRSQSIVLEPIGCTLAIGELYLNVDFSASGSG